jgi:RNA polymerase sigma factor (sigma-70 family)
MPNGDAHNYSNERWLFDIFLTEYDSMKFNLVKCVHNEVDAEQILGKIYDKVAVRLNKDLVKFNGSGHAKAYLRKSVRYACGEWRKKKQPVFISVSDWPSNDPNMAFQHQPCDLFQLLSPMIEELPPQLKDVIKLRYIHGLSNDQIAQQLNLPTTVISVYKSRGLSRLREKIRINKISCSY